MKNKSMIDEEIEHLLSDSNLSDKELSDIQDALYLQKQIDEVEFIDSDG